MTRDSFTRAGSVIAGQQTRGQPPDGLLSEPAGTLRGVGEEGGPSKLTIIRRLSLLNLVGLKVLLLVAVESGTEGIAPSVAQTCPQLAAKRKRARNRTSYWVSTGGSGASGYGSQKAPQLMSWLKSGFSPRGMRPNRSNEIADNVISSNDISYTGRDYHDSAGIFVGFTTGTIITHNTISHTPWSAVAIGWGWELFKGGSSPGLPTATPGMWGDYSTPTITSDDRSRETDSSFSWSSYGTEGRFIPTVRRGLTTRTRLSSLSINLTFINNVPTMSVGDVPNWILVQAGAQGTAGPLWAWGSRAWNRADKDAKGSRPRPAAYLNRLRHRDSTKSITLASRLTPSS